MLPAHLVAMSAIICLAGFLWLINLKLFSFRCRCNRLNLLKSELSSQLQLFFRGLVWRKQWLEIKLLVNLRGILTSSSLGSLLLSHLTLSVIHIKKFTKVIYCIQAVVVHCCLLIWPQCLWSRPKYHGFAVPDHSWVSSDSVDLLIQPRMEALTWVPCGCCSSGLLMAGSILQLLM